ncbi:glycosyltransferase family 2 protein [soil metagenome]
MKYNLSFVIPARNEEKSIETLYKEIIHETKKIKAKYEIIFIDDGSTDKTFDIFKKLIKKDKNVKTIKFRGNWGKSMALQAGFSKAKGNIIFTLDADLQDDPKEIPNFLKKINEGYDLVSGWKKIRHDPISKVVPSRILNFTISKLTGLNIHDTNCGFKAYRYEVVDNLNLYGELYRFIPVMAVKQNFKVAEIIISHRKRKFGKSKFGIERNIKGLLDLLTVVFLTNYLKRPGHFFGTAGLISFSGGFVIGIYLSFIRFTTGSFQDHQPLLMLGLLLMIVGVQLVSTGLIAEMILSFNQNKNNISSIIKETIPSSKI